MGRRGGTHPAVHRRTAAAVLIRQVDDNGNETYIQSNEPISYPPLRPGMRVTTSPILDQWVPLSDPKTGEYAEGVR